MFKSIQWKILTTFVLMVISVMIIVGTFLLWNVSNYYARAFTKQMSESVFIPELTGELSTASQSEQAVSDMASLLGIYAGRIGVDSFRNYYILNGSGELLYSSNGSEGKIAVTENILSAMNGETGHKESLRSEIMDYAYPVKDGNTVKHIVYVMDTKDEVNGIMSGIFGMILWALLLGLIISTLLGLFVSRTIIMPIVSLKKKAEKMASGDFGTKMEVKSEDEIGDLTVAFNKMSADLKTTMEEIAREKNKIETILFYMTDGVMAFDKEGNIIHINPAAKAMLSVTRKKINFDQLFQKLEVKVSLAEVLYLERAETMERSVRVNEKDLKAYFAPFSTKAGRNEGVVVVLQDITEQLKLDNSRREFVANVSHELRTPLTTIKSYIETLAETAEKGSVESNFLNITIAETDRMTRLVKDLLTLSKLDYEKAVLNKSEFSAEKLVHEVVRKLGMEAGKRGLEMSEEIKKCPAIFADRDKIEQVVTNILSNAIKYTPSGGKITVMCGQFFTDVVIKVTDTGIGIPEEDLSRIFERFYRVDKARTRKSGGTGLGLAIAKEIVELHDGKIEIKSKEMSGTEVTITLPIYRQSKK